MRKRKRSDGPRYVCLYHWMLDSTAWKALSPKAFKVLVHIWRCHSGSNNGQIVYAVRDAEEIGLTRSAAGRALTELIEAGFLRVTRSAAFTVKTKEARLWELTAEATIGQPATKDFMRGQAKPNGGAPPRFGDEARAARIARTKLTDLNGSKTVSAGAQRMHRYRQRKAAEESSQASQQASQQASHSPKNGVTQSHQRDRGVTKASQNAISVPPAGPSGVTSVTSQSHQRDTSISTRVAGGRGNDGDGTEPPIPGASPSRLERPPPARAGLRSTHPERGRTPMTDAVESSGTTGDSNRDVRARKPARGKKRDRGDWQLEVALQRDAEAQRYIEANLDRYGLEGVLARWRNYEQLIVAKYQGPDADCSDAGTINAAWRARDRYHCAPMRRKI